MPWRSLTLGVLGVEGRPAKPAKPVVLGALVVAILAVSTASVLFRLSEAPALVKAAYRLLYATLLLAPFALARHGRELRSLPARDWLGLAAVGVVLAVHFASWIRSLDLTSVASSVFLVTLHPLVVAAASAFLFREALGARGWIGAAVAVAGGAWVVFADASGGTPGSAPLAGDALALVGAVAAGAYFLAGRSYRKRLPLLVYVVPVYAACALTLVALAAASGDALGGWPLREHAIFLALAVGPMVFGHTVLNWALAHVSAPAVATTVVGEPLGASLLAWLVLGEGVSTAALPGFALVLGGLLLVAFDEAKRFGAPASDVAPG